MRFISVLVLLLYCQIALFGQLNEHSSVKKEWFSIDSLKNYTGEVCGIDSTVFREYYCINLKDGVLHGRTTVYIEDDKFMVIANYENGKLNGEVKYFSNRKLYQLMCFRANVLHKKTIFRNDGGITIEYYNSGFIDRFEIYDKKRRIEFVKLFFGNHLYSVWYRKRNADIKKIVVSNKDSYLGEIIFDKSGEVKKSTFNDKKTLSHLKNIIPPIEYIETDN